jgi:tetratricopeptide (TPR) repeat protein
VPSRERLTAYLTTRALAASTRLFGPDAIVTQAQFDDDASDIAGAVGWALEAGRRGMAVDLLLASLDGWTAAGRHVEALDLTLQALDHVPHQGPEAARLLAAATQLTHQLTDHERARSFGRQALDLAERLGDRESAARALAPLAATLVFSGEVAEGAALAETAAAEAEALGLYPLSVHALFVLGMARAMSGDFDGERRAHEARLAAARTRGDLKGTADALNTLAEIAVDNADGETAEVFAAEAVALAEGRLPTVARDAALTRARAALLQGDLPAAARQLVPALDLGDRLGQTFAVAQGLRVGGCLAAASGDADTAVRLFASAHALSPSPGGAEVPPEQDLAAPLTEARASLGGPASTRAWTLGAGLPPAAARAQLAVLLTRLTESPTHV